MALNEMIAQGAQFNVPDPVAQYAKMQQLQAVQNQNALAQYQLGSAQRGDVQQNALYKRLQDPNFSQENPEHLASLAQFGTPGITAMKAITEAQNAALTGSKTRGDILKQKTDHVNQMKRDLSVNPSDAQIDAYTEDLKTSGLYKPNEITAATAQFQRLKDVPFEQRQAFLSSAGATAGDIMTATTAAAGRKTTERGQDIAASTAKAGQDVTLRGQTLLDAREKENIKIRQEDQRRASDPAFQQRMAGAKAVGEAIAKGDVAAQQALPKIITRAEDGLRLIDDMVGKQEIRDAKGKVLQAATPPHPGFQNAVGSTWVPGARFVPGTDAANFMSRFDQIKGASFLEAFEALKGGGSITEKEGSKGTDAINRMSISTDEKEFLTAARDLQDVIRKGVANAQSRASRSGGTVTTAPNIDALLEKYK